MKKLYILKIGGSVATEKSAGRAIVRHALLSRIFKAIKTSLPRDTQLIIIHGAGSFGHGLAKKYSLRKGTGAHKDGKQGAVLTRLAMQRLNTEVLELAVKAGLLATSVHTGSFFTQKNDASPKADLAILTHALTEGYTPILYGEMVFDTTLGMTVCGGDRIAAYLAKKLLVEQIFFASDVDGIFTDDPHVSKKATLVRDVSLSRDMKQFSLGESHSVDVTGGLKGKMETCANLFKTAKALEEMHIFNGLKIKNYAAILSSAAFPHTTIKK